MRRSTRNFVLFAAPLTLCALGLAFWLLWPRDSAITEENIARIQQGMTRAEVEAILGGPARNDTGGRRWPLCANSNVLKRRVGEPPDQEDGEWIGDEMAVVVSFNFGQVYDTRVGHVLPFEESLLGRFRRWLRL